MPRKLTETGENQIVAMYRTIRSRHPDRLERHVVIDISKRLQIGEAGVKGALNRRFVGKDTFPVNSGIPSFHGIPGRKYRFRNRSRPQGSKITIYPKEAIYLGCDRGVKEIHKFQHSEVSWPISYTPEQLLDYEVTPVGSGRGV